MDGTTSTSDLAFDRASVQFGSRRARILTILNARGPSTLFEIAAILELHDHQISGRITELLAEGLIERTGERRPKPETGCLADVYRVGTPMPPLDLGEALNHPDTLVIGEEGIFERQPFTGHEGLPGVPYVRSSHQGAVPRLLYRVSLVECDGCGRPILQTTEGGAKIYRCNSRLQPHLAADGGPCAGQSWNAGDGDDTSLMVIKQTIDARRRTCSIVV